MSLRQRSTLVYGAIVLVVFVGALVASFVYTHEPQRDTLSVTVAGAPGTPTAERVVAGTVSEVANGTLHLHTEAGDVAVTLPAGVPAVELQHVAADAAPLATGVGVNVGGEQTQTGLVVSGIVVVSGAP